MIIKLLRIILVAACVFFIGTLGIIIPHLIAKAFAQEDEHSHHPPQDEAIHEQFYNTWMQPDNRNASCCHKVDCSPAESYWDEARQMWFARKVNDGKDAEFAPIPSIKVEHDRDSPDGRSHMCGRKGMMGSMNVFCFIPGTGG
jgi:hypothetical protein